MQSLIFHYLMLLCANSNPVSFLQMEFQYPEQSIFYDIKQVHNEIHFYQNSGKQGVLDETKTILADDCSGVSDIKVGSFVVANHNKLTPLRTLSPTLDQTKITALNLWMKQNCVQYYKVAVEEYDLTIKEIDHSFLQEFGSTDNNVVLFDSSMTEGGLFGAKGLLVQKDSAEVRTSEKKEPRIATVSLQKVTIDGNLDENLFEETVQRYLHQIRYCYQRELVKYPSVSGSVLLEIEIAIDGSVQQSTYRKSTLSSNSVEKCIIAKSQSFIFPKASDGQIVIANISYNFDTE